MCCSANVLLGEYTDTAVWRGDKGVDGAYCSANLWTDPEESTHRSNSERLCPDPTSSCGGSIEHGGNCLWSPTKMRFFGCSLSNKAVLDSGVHPHSSTITVCTVHGSSERCSSQSRINRLVLAIVQRICE